MIPAFYTTTRKGGRIDDALLTYLLAASSHSSKYYQSPMQVNFSDWIETGSSNLSQMLEI